MRYLSLLLLLTACGNPFSAPDAVPFTRPAIYADLWQQVEACSGVTGDLSRISWYQVPTGSLSYKGESAHGVWQSQHMIYVEADAVHDTYPQPAWGNVPAPFLTIRHEMLHDLLQTGTHPATFTTCGV